MSHRSRVAPLRLPPFMVVLLGVALALSAVAGCASWTGTSGRGAYDGAGTRGTGTADSGDGVGVTPFAERSEPQADAVVRPLAAPAPRGLRRLIAGGVEQTSYTFTYDPSYVRLAYPGGDVPKDRGVCTDVIVRAMRKAGIDLQKLVHEDMTEHFGAYPKRWGLARPDPNIDHRRVPNLATFFSRHGKKLPATREATHYLPGDFVTWTVWGRDHIGLVTDRYSPFLQRYLVVHNIGAGARIEDLLFAYPITGHYRWFRR